MMTDTEFHTEGVALPHDQNVLVLCESAQRNLSSDAKQAFRFLLPPSSPIDEVRKLLADNLSVAPASVHLQVRGREGDTCVVDTTGSVADALEAANPLTRSITFVYQTESKYGCDCCQALCCGCCVGLCVGCCVADS